LFLEIQTTFYTRLLCLARVTFLLVVRIKSSARSFMHIYAHIPQRIMCPRVIYRAGTCTRVCTYLVIYPPHFSSSDGRSSAESIFAIHSFLEGRTRFSSFDGNLVVSDQRQLGTYPLLSTLVCSFVDAFTMLPPFPNVLFTLRVLRAPFYAVFLV